MRNSVPHCRARAANTIFSAAIYHPSVGFLAGWISATVGFAAPVAIAAKPFGTYLADIFPGTNALFLSLAVVWITTFVLLQDLRLGSLFQNASTILKVALISSSSSADFWSKSTQPVSFLPAKGDGALILSAPFAVSLYWVMYAYSGWNASTYIVGEVRNPARNIPFSVVTRDDTRLVVLYLGLECRVHAHDSRERNDREGTGRARRRRAHFRSRRRQSDGVVHLPGLISTVSAMMWIGPRVTATMGEDFHGTRDGSRARNAHGIPTVAILVQFAIVNVLLLTATFQAVVNYVQFSLALCCAVTVLGVFVLRWREPELPRPYRTWGYPVTPLIFLAISVWMLWHMLATETTRAPVVVGIRNCRAGLGGLFCRWQNR